MRPKNQKKLQRVWKKRKGEENAKFGMVRACFDFKKKIKRNLAVFTSFL